MNHGYDTTKIWKHDKSLKVGYMDVIIGPYLCLCMSLYILYIKSLQCLGLVLLEV